MRTAGIQRPRALKSSKDGSSFGEGAQVTDTGYIGDEINEGNGSMVVNLPPGSATSVLVRVSGLDDTYWTYTVHCPS